MPWGCLSRARDVAAWSVAAIVLAGCPADNGSVSPAVSPSPSVAAIGGAVRVGVFGEPATLDPYSEFATDLTYVLARPIYRSLFTMLPDGTAAPDLAADIEVLPGGARIVLVDATWADGTPITAADVAASIRRARAPSGFAQITAARVLDGLTIEMRGAVQDWPLTLAQGGFILPDGKPGGPSGPWTVTKRVPGLKIVYEPLPGFSPRPLLDRMVVFFVESDATLRTLLERGEIDVAPLPATTNLGDRLEGAGLEHSAAAGSEVITIDFARSGLARRERRGFLAQLPIESIKSRLVRDLGTTRPTPRAGGQLDRASTLRVAVPEGDELLALIQRAIYERLTARGYEVDLAAVEALSIYARSSEGIVIKRLNGLDDNVLTSSMVPLFDMDSVAAFTERIVGVQVNPWMDGVLWNAEDWSLAPD